MRWFDSTRLKPEPSRKAPFSLSLKLFSRTELLEESWKKRPFQHSLARFLSALEFLVFWK